MITDLSVATRSDSLPRQRGADAPRGGRCSLSAATGSASPVEVAQQIKPPCVVSPCWRCRYSGGLLRHDFALAIGTGAHLRECPLLGCGPWRVAGHDHYPQRGCS